MLEKGPGGLKYPAGKGKKITNPLERTFEASNGVFDDEVAESTQGDVEYKPSVKHQTGDDGKG